MKTYNYGKQHIDLSDILAVIGVLKSPFLTCGPKVREFEQAICKYTGAKYCVAVSSATAGLHIAMLSLGIKEGGELYVKKIPSMRMPDLARAIAPNLAIKEIGIRPGEKVHEQMITREDARNTIDVGEFYIILPEINIEHINYKYANSKPVADDFEYHSGNNDRWLSVEDMRKLIEELE